MVQRTNGFGKDSVSGRPGGGPGLILGAVRILIVEDEDAIATPLGEALRREGHLVERAVSAAEALTAPEPDLVLLDLRLPDMDGQEVARRMRSRSSTPIIIVSARGEEVDRVVGLELGADDYVVKPFGMRELLARIAAVARRSAGGAEEPVVRCGALEVDRRARRVTLAGREIALTPREYELLSLLAADAGALVTRERILREVWRTRWHGATKIIDVHVGAIRRKLGDARWIETVRGVGFRLGRPA